MNNLIGRQLAGRYRIEEHIGEGGMARVYRAWDAKRLSWLAIKLLREDLSQDPVFLRRFRREAQTLETLQHPSIVRTYGLEQDDLLAFIVMDLVEGHSLRAEIFRRQGQPFEAERVLEIVRPVASALHFAHQIGMAHCDVKPANILIDASGRVLLSDFGVARLTDTAATLTMMSSGTPAYMAPEQILGLDPTPATDIYALGIVIYEMLAGGERPFTGERAHTTGSTAEKVRWEHLNVEAPSLRALNPVVSPALEAVVSRCLEKDGEKLYASAEELLRALERVVLTPEAVEEEEVTLLPAGATVEAEVEITEVEVRPAKRMRMSLPRGRKAWALNASAGMLMLLSWLNGNRL